MDTATAPPDALDEACERADDALPLVPSPEPRPGNRWATAAWIGSSLLLVVLVVGIWLRVSGDRAGVDLTNAIITGKRPTAPALPTTPVAKGSGLPDWYAAKAGRQLADDDNQVLVVNWWASWCAPCREEAPILQEVADDYDGRVTVVGINAASEDLASDARSFAREFDLDFPLVRGDRADNDAWGGIDSYPETFVIGTDGRISAFVNGPVDEETIRGLVEAELDEDRS